VFRRPFLAAACAASAAALTLVATPATARPAPLAQAAADPDQLLFSATVPSDPQRSQGEPAVTVDKSGRIYSCGPTGFSSVNDFASVSTDGGDQFHLMGSPPRGQMSTAEGGGDCALASAPVKNAGGDNTLAYAGLGPLTNFSTATSSDGGRTLTGSPISESNPGVDRQWITFLDASTAILAYNGSAPSGKTVQKSTDGGLTYGKSVVATSDGGRIGQIRSFLPADKTDRLTQSIVYIPYNSGNNVKLAVSLDSGTTWKTCTAINAGVSPAAGFVSADHDQDGNVYMGYGENGGGRDTYIVPIPYARLLQCGSVANLAAPKIKVNSGDAQLTMFPWIAARGLPGRVAIAYYATDRPTGNPDSADFDAAWYVYVAQSLDAFDAAPTVTQVRASTHPFHYDSICTAGLNCTINFADRSLVDYFTMEFNEGTGALAIVYSQPAKMPDEETGHVATPAVIVQVAGPSHTGGLVDGGFRREVLRSSSPDPAGDAVSGYSILNLGTDALAPANKQIPALDLVDTAAGGPAVQVGAEVDGSGTPVADGGFTVTMRVKDLSDAALRKALTDAAGGGTSLVYLFRFVDGYQSAGVSARWAPGVGWDYAYTGYQVQNAGCASSGEECTTYNKDQALTGRVDVAAGTVSINVPRGLLTALGTADSAGRPSERGAVAGDRLYDATAFTLINPAAKDAQTFMEQVDNAPAFDFVLGTEQSPVVPETSTAAVLLVLAVAVTGAALVRGRRRTAA
jgi:hypothetical protein